MTYEEMFAMVKDKIKDADVSGVDGHYAYQVNITGEGAGIFYIEIKDGQLFVEPYDYKNHDAKFTTNMKNFLKICEGKTDPITAFTLGQLKVEGDFTKALALKKILGN